MGEQERSEGWFERMALYHSRCGVCGDARGRRTDVEALEDGTVEVHRTLYCPTCEPHLRFEPEVSR